MEIQTLRRRDQLLVGFTLFSMFFGAGNLIFPPQLGAQAGVDTWFAMAGLAVSAVFLPILGVIAVVRAGSLTDLASRVHPAFATVFTVLIYLSIGPCLAIPRTASTSFEMAVPPFPALRHSYRCGSSSAIPCSFSPPPSWWPSSRRS